MCQYPLFRDRTLRDPPPAKVQLSCPHSPASWRLLNQSAANLRTSTFAWSLDTRGQRGVVLCSAVFNYLSLCCSLTWFSAFPRMSQKRCPWELAMADPALGSVLQPQVFLSKDPGHSGSLAYTQVPLGTVESILPSISLALIYIPGWRAFQHCILFIHFIYGITSTFQFLAETAEHRMPSRKDLSSMNGRKGRHLPIIKRKCIAHKDSSLGKGAYL